MARLFFALWPDETAARSLNRLARSLALQVQGKPVPPSKIHLTLAFLGEVAVARIALAPVAIASTAFDLALDRVGSFPEARVAWAGFSAPPAELSRLQSRLAGELRGRGFVLEDRPFAPHLTLVRRINEPLAREAIDPIAWRAREVALVRSEAGSYTTLKAWRLPD